MNSKSSADGNCRLQSSTESALIGKQQLLIKAKLRRNALVAKQQLAVKSSLAAQRKAGEIER